MKVDKNSEETKNFLKDYAPYFGLGLQIALTVGVMVFLGLWLDKVLNTSPYLTISSSFIGIFAALYNFIKTVTKEK